MAFSTRSAGFFKGVGEVAAETVEGVATLATNTAKTAYDVAGGAVVDGVVGVAEAVSGEEIDKPDWAPDLDRGVDRLKSAGEVVGTVVANPGMVVDAVVDPIKEDWNAGRYGEAIGRGFAETVGLVAGTKGVDKAAKGANIADAGRVADKAADAADNVADVGRAQRIESSGQRRPKPPSAHRTVRTGPYTAPHVRRIH